MDSQLPGCGEVVVTFVNRNSHLPCLYPRRRVSLTHDTPTIQIGRTSKRNTSFEAKTTNCWFDSPVMSREHAQLHFDAKNQKLYITDATSLHGTFLNDSPLIPNEKQNLRDGDIVRFGIPIERGRETYDPYTMAVSVQYGSLKPNDQPVIFRVPDDTDIEDNEDVSGDEDPSLQHSTRLLRLHNIRPALSTPTKTSVSIDLTEYEEDATLDSTIRQQDTPVKTDERLSTSINTQHVDLTTQDDDPMNEPVGRAPASLYDPSSVTSSTAYRIDDEDDHQDYGPSHVFDESRDADICLTATSDSESDVDSSPRYSPSESDRLGRDSSIELSTPLFHSEAEAEAVTDVSDDECNSFSEHESSLNFDSEVDDDDDDDNSTYALQDNQDKAKPMAGVPTLVTPESDDHLRTGVANHEQIPVEQTQEPTIAPGDLWAPPLPPRRAEVPKIPDLLHSSTQSAQNDLRLPPILSAIPEPEHSRPNPNVYYRAESDIMTVPTLSMMAERTGKFEYFYAREHNKAVAQTGLGSLGAETISTSWMPSAPENPEQAGNMASNGTIQVAEGTAQCEPLARPNEHLSTNTAEVPGPWSMSGEKFLSSPLSTNDCEINQESRNEHLDETSAYSYEVSKKAAHSHTYEKETFMAIDNLVDPPSEMDVDNQHTEEIRPKKRKADDISELNAEEQAREAENSAVLPNKNNEHNSENNTPSNSTLLQEANASAHEQNLIVLGRDITRPAKRMYRAAEVVCYAALGGAAVMTALIATAPTF